MSARLTSAAPGGLSRVPYLPGLDGLRAIAVVAVMLYHAHLVFDGGFLGVEVFFVISGYLITLLLLAEHEKNGFVNLGQFWLRRARRLLPALFVMMAVVAVYTAAFFPAAREETRGDFIGGIFYVSNWYQLWVGQGYGAGEAFAPLRHLWSLAVEEQFYILWPLVMLAVLRRNRGRLPSVGLKFFGLSFVVAGLTAMLYYSGPVLSTDGNYRGYWSIGSKQININEFLYLGSISRAGGLLLGAGFAMLWRPMAIIRGPLRDKGRRLDVMAAVAIVLLLAQMASTSLIRNDATYSPWLFRGGFLLTGLLTLVLIAAVTHQHAQAGKVFGNPVLKWIGTRSYGLYLYHWPIFQFIRKEAQIDLTVPEFLFAMLLTGLITEASYRFIETPIRTGHFKEMMRGVRRQPAQVAASAAVSLALLAGTVSFLTADPQCVGAVACANEANAANTTQPPVVTDPVTSTTPGDSTASTVAATTTTLPQPEAFVAIGESVMVGAVNQLTGNGVFVDARENRGPEGVKNTVIKLRDAGQLGAGTTVVIQVGTNAPMGDSEVAAIMAEMPPGVGTVHFMTLHADVAWIPGNNDLIKSLPSAYPGVQVIDWDARAPEVELCPDGIHLTCGGSGPANFYANLILQAFGLPLIA